MQTIQGSVILAFIGILPGFWNHLVTQMVKRGQAKLDKRKER